MHYFDSTATTKPSKEVLDMYNKVSNEYWYNISGQYRLGVSGKSLFDRASKQILNSLKLKNKKVIFTSGATEANNNAIYGICDKYLGQNKHIITTLVEHSSVLNCFKDLEKKGFQVTYLKINQEGIIDIEELKRSITNNTIFISIMWVNNIIGSIMPIKEIIEIVKKNPKIKLHVDAVQGIGKIKNDFDFENIDLLTISGHKIHGLKGAGALIINDNLALSPHIIGGHQQDNLRAGTVDLAGVMSLAVALKNALEKQAKSFEIVSKMYNYLVEELSNLSFIVLNKSTKYYSPYILSVTFKNIRGETVMHYLENYDIYVGIGSACNEKTKILEPTIVLIQEMNERFDNDNYALNTIRVSLSEENTMEDVEKLLEKIKELGNR